MIETMKASLCEGLVIAVGRELDIDIREMSAGYRFVRHGDDYSADLFLYDTLSGGAGYATQAGSAFPSIFDQLENLVAAEGAGPRLLAYAHLSSELVDVLRGLVLVHMALDTEWKRGIEPSLNLSQRSRLLMRRETLELPTAGQREELLRKWAERLPERREPFPWPLTEARLHQLCRAPGLTPRMLQIEFRRTVEGEDSDLELPASAGKSTAEATVLPTVEELTAGLSDEWESCLVAARRALDHAASQRACMDTARLADGLLSCGRFLDGARLGPANSSVAGEILLQVKERSTRVAFLHQSHHRSVATALGRLTTLAEREHVVVVRERAHDLPPTWKDTLARRRALLATGRARWIALDRDDAARLLALDSLLQAARSGDVTNDRGQPVIEDAVARWVAATLDVPGWTFLVDLLGKSEDEVVELQSDPVAEPPSVRAALTLLSRLRLASLDRIVREVVRIDATATRASVVAELEAHPDRVRWFGRTIVCVREVS